MKNIILKIISKLIYVFIFLNFLILAIITPENWLSYDYNGGKLYMTMDKKDFLHVIKHYYKSIFDGGLGTTVRGETIWNYMKPIIPKSLILIFLSLAISLLLGILKGILDSRKDRERRSTLKLMTTVIGLSFPEIFIGVLLQSFMVWLYRKGIKALPVGGYRSFKHIILPTITLSLFPTMYIARVTSLTIDDIYSKEYIRTAIGKGASRRRVLYIHVLKQALPKIIGSFSYILSTLIASLVVVEYLFYYPGLAYVMLFKYSIGEKSVAIGAALFLSITYFTLKLIIKFLAFFIDPIKRSKLRMGGIR